MSVEILIWNENWTDQTMHSQIGNCRLCAYVIRHTAKVAEIILLNLCSHIVVHCAHDGNGCLASFALSFSFISFSFCLSLFNVCLVCLGLLVFCAFRNKFYFIIFSLKRTKRKLFMFSSDERQNKSRSRTLHNTHTQTHGAHDDIRKKRRYTPTPLTDDVIGHRFMFKCFSWNQLDWCVILLIFESIYKFWDGRRLRRSNDIAPAANFCFFFTVHFIDTEKVGLQIAFVAVFFFR